jgi:hypothetical protein
MNFLVGELAAFEFAFEQMVDPAAFDGLRALAPDFLAQHVRYRHPLTDDVERRAVLPDDLVHGIGVFAPFRFRQACHPHGDDAGQRLGEVDGEIGAAFFDEFVDQLGDELIDHRLHRLNRARRHQRIEQLAPFLRLGRIAHDRNAIEAFGLQFRNAVRQKIEIAQQADRIFQQAEKSAADRQATGNGDAFGRAERVVVAGDFRDVLITTDDPETAVLARARDRAFVAHVIQDVVGVFGVFRRVMVEIILHEIFDIEIFRPVH